MVKHGIPRSWIMIHDPQYFLRVENNLRINHQPTRVLTSPERQGEIEVWVSPHLSEGPPSQQNPRPGIVYTIGKCQSKNKMQVKIKIPMIKTCISKTPPGRTHRLPEICPPPKRKRSK